MNSFEIAFEAERRNSEILTKLMELHMNLMVNAAAYGEKFDSETKNQFKAMDRVTLKLIKRNCEKLGLSM